MNDDPAAPRESNHLEFVLTLREALARLDEPPGEEALQLAGSTFLVPLEYETLGRIQCPACGGHEWGVTTQAALGKRGGLEWHHLIGGDRLSRGCRRCGQRLIVTFWFSE